MFIKFSPISFIFEWDTPNTTFTNMLSYCDDTEFPTLYVCKWFTFFVYLFEAMKKQIQYVENCRCIVIFTQAVNSDI